MKKVLLLLIVAVSVWSCDKDEVDYAERDDQLIREYLENAGVLEQTTRDASGLYYRVLKEGNGSISPNAYAKIAYHGRVMGEAEDFEGGETTGNLSQYIKGWQIGIPKLTVGAEAMLYIPSDLAYGARATGKIPAHSVLIFHVRVVQVY